MRPCGLALTALLLASPAWAGAPDCDRPTATQRDLDECAGAGFKTADAALNRTYKDIMARLQGADFAAERQALTAAQRAWIGFRDAECRFQTTGVDGGSIRPMLEAQCLDYLTEQRTHQLGAYLHCQEGDLSCPVPGR